MDRKLLILLIACIAAPSFINAQVTLNCVFVVSGANYDCTLNAAFVADNEELTVNFGGVHQPPRTNADVTRIIMTSSLIPFVIPSIFTTFVNLREYHYTNSVFATRVQANAFANALYVEEITIANTGGLNLTGNGFTNAVNLQRLNLQTNMLTAVPPNLLNGFVNLTSIDFSNNQIGSISDTFIRTNTRLTTVNFNNNLLRRLPNTLLLTNNLLTTFLASTNEIYQIGRRFLEPVELLTTLSLSGNECINVSWANIGGVGGPTKETINTQLQTCFNNYVGGGELRAFGMLLRGRITLYDENGNIVGTL